MSSSQTIGGKKWFSEPSNAVGGRIVYYLRLTQARHGCSAGPAYLYTCFGSEDQAVMWVAGNHRRGVVGIARIDGVAMF